MYNEHIVETIERLFDTSHGIVKFAFYGSIFTYKDRHLRSSQIHFKMLYEVYWPQSI